MADVHRSLGADIPTSYTVFERDQVLTHDQLNGAVDYLDVQQRLTRVALLGVGIVCGLRVSLQDGVVRLTRGVGVTTDGDLLRAASDATYDRYRPYGEGAPGYAPFLRDGARVAAWELVSSDAGDEGASAAGALALGEFEAREQRALAGTVAVLLVESYVKSQDLCTGADCDNLGDLSLHAVKLVLIDAANAAGFRGELSRPGQIAQALAEVVAERAAISGVTSARSLAEAYRAACGLTHDRLVDAWQGLVSEFDRANPFPDFATSSASLWLRRLTETREQFRAADFGLQYYYDFLKDLAETWNAFRDRLFDLTGVCCPDAGAFPKHLLLGGLAAGSAPDPNRVGLYPSPLVGGAREDYAHARFLLSKLDAMVSAWSAPNTALDQYAIKVTPSLFEDRDLEERAIPFYYGPAVRDRWSYARQRRGMSEYNYGYHAAPDSARGGAANPFGSQLGRFTFFRVEGHLGKPVDKVVEAVEREIKSRNLPLAVRAVKLDGDAPGIFKKPGIRYTDLHRIHGLVRRELSDELEGVAKFGQDFKQHVDEVAPIRILDGASARAAKDAATSKGALIRDRAQRARAALDKRHSEYARETAWRDDVKEVMGAAADLKHDLRDVAKTTVITPFDSLITNTRFRWLDWLDDIIKTREEKADRRLLFRTFLGDHPGLEHFGGVTRGGTLVLAYDATRVVVADFMLPYLCCDAEEEEEDPPAATPAKVKPDLTLAKVFDLEPPFVARVRDELDVFKREIEPRFVQQREFVNLVKDSFTLASDVVTRPNRAVPSAADEVQDTILGSLVRGAQEASQTLKLLRDKRLDAAVSPTEAARLDEQIKSAEHEVAGSVVGIMKHATEAQLKTGAGEDGRKAVVAATEFAGALRDANALRRVSEGIEVLAPNDRTGLVQAYRKYGGGK